MNSFLSYMGGKSLLTKKIIPLIPQHQCYCEVFSGAAWLLFRKEESEVEIINDINSDLVTLYRVIKHHLEEFMKAGYASRIENPSFSISTLRKSNFNLLRVEEELSAAHLRLSRVYIENMNYKGLIERFDKPHTFFYIDPPYYDCEDYYGKGIFSKDDFKVLAGLLASVQGKFIMSINDTSEIRELYEDFNIQEVTTTYSAGGAHIKKHVTELLIMNYGHKCNQI